MESQYRSLFILVTVLFSLIFAQLALAGSATWRLHPTANDWNTAANWTPMTVPNGPNDTATFTVSDTTDVLVTATQTEVDGIVFTPGAIPLTITINASTNSTTLILSGIGIANNSAITQNILVSNFSYGGELNFTNGATAGTQTFFTAEHTGDIAFHNEATAGFGTFTIKGTPFFEDGHPHLYFFDNSSAANGTFINTGGSGGTRKGEPQTFPAIPRLRMAPLRIRRLRTRQLSQRAALCFLRTRPPPTVLSPTKAAQRLRMGAQLASTTMPLREMPPSLLMALGSPAV